MKFDSSNLPSRGIPYAVKSIEVSPFRPKHLPYISEAIFMENSAPLIEAVGQVMDFDVKQLTDGDFYYILTWLRFNSRDLPIFAEWDCGGIVFERKDNGQILTMEDIDNMWAQWDAAKGTEAEEHMEDPAKIEMIELDCDQYNKQDVVFEDFTTKQMDETPIDPLLDYPRVAHLVEYLELGQEKRNKKIIGPVRYIRAGRTLHEKLNGALESTDMELFDKASRAHFTYDHGIIQRVNKACTRCGLEHPFDVTIDAHSFFI